MSDSAVAEGLSRAYEHAQTRSLPAAAARLVIFSDHHKGARDGADDFLRCEPAYCAALTWYLEHGYTLYILGDAEELWENDPEPVLRQKTGYPEVLELEARFHRAGRYERFSGNHDDLWSHSRPVARHLHRFFPGIDVREALKLRLTRPGAPDALLVLLHGHQGTADSDRGRGISRLFVRFVWRRIQRRSGYTGVTPAQSYELRAEHDRAMSLWASTHPDKPILITGHTHRPVFWDSKPAPRSAPPPGDGGVERRVDEAWQAAKQRNRPQSYQLPTPCYFNTGCCCFGDGDVTGLELADGEIRLVRWPLDDGTPRRKILANRPLDDVLDTVAGRVPKPVAGQESGR
jgi:UDP-2,3-diacylglucosamine pyrophosphatase LpxH